LELIRFVGAVDEKAGLDKQAVEVGLSCFAAIPGTRQARSEMVRLGAVPAAVRVLAMDAGSPSLALPVLDAAVGCAEGRAAIREKADAAVPAVLSKMMKGGMAGAKAGVSVH
jgi:hypothetical protein